MPFDDDDLPSLDDIFSTPIKRVKLEKENKRDKENNDYENEKDYENKNKDKEKDIIDHQPLKLNMPVFVYKIFDRKFVPGIVIDIGEDSYYTVKCYDGELETIGRKYIYCTTDTKFYSINPVPLKTILQSKNVMIRPFVKKNILNLVEEQKDVLIQILKGEIESERDLIFRSGKRFSMNSENSPGPFTLEEYNFLLEHFPDILIPNLLKGDSSLRECLEKRFEKTGKSLDHLLRQYSYLVLVPEFTVRHILKIDSSVKTLEEADHKLLNNSTAYDLETGNFINYLYSKQEMYSYARRELKKGVDCEDLEDE